ncbi:DUF2690 domain-containing protein, partial [Streptomyces fuscigenes]|uniref:DUF2690 domain-containing protein n=1 Tax=Streptomyces fuscigenes TaxID=1528880 RepID=UPI001F22AF5F
RCHGASCEGRDPGAMLCGRQPATLRSEPVAGGRRVDVRYSGACSSAWARVSGSRVGDRISIAGPSRPQQSARARDAFDTSGYVFTPMTPAGPRTALRACLRPVRGRAVCLTATPAGR